MIDMIGVFPQLPAAPPPVLGGAVSRLSQVLGIKVGDALLGIGLVGGYRD